MKKVVIIGAGIGGLSLANILAKAGYDVHIYEKNSELGGRAGKLTIDGFTFDTGPSWYLMPEVFSHYYELFGINAEKELSLKRLTPAYKVFFDSRQPVTIQGDLAHDSRTFETIEAGAGDALEKYVATSTKRYSLALKHFLYTNYTQLSSFFHPDITKNMPELVGALSTPLHTQVKNSFSSQPLQQILEYPMVFLGTSPFTAPSLYSLMSALDFKDGVFYPKKGIYAIIDSLVSIGKSLGVSYHLNSPVSSINVREKVTTGITLESSETISADIVISNADLHFTETSLLPKNARSFDESYWTKKESGISALLIYAGVKGELPNLEHHNLFFGDAWKETFDDIYKNKQTPSNPSFYISRTTATDPSTAPKNNENIFILVPLPTATKYTAKELQALANATLDKLGTLIDEPAFKKRISIKKIFGPDDFKQEYNAWEGTALGPSHILTQSAFFRTPNKSKKVKNLYYVGGSTTPGIGMPMCLIGAELVYKRIAGDTTSSPIKRIEKII